MWIEDVDPSVCGYPLGPIVARGREEPCSGMKRAISADERWAYASDGAPV